MKQNNFLDYKKHKWFIIIGLFAFTFLLYANTLSNDYAIDDMIVTTDNPLVHKGIDGIGELISHGYFYANTGRNDESYRPLSMVMIALETEFFGLKPSVNHFFNVLFYSLTSVILFLFLRLIFKEKNIAIPLAISLLFLSHPIHTEVVANIKSRDEIMQLFFMILSLFLLLKASENFNCQTFIKCITIFGSIFSYFLALMSKEIAITFLAVIPLLLYFFSDFKIKKIVIYTIPYFAIFLIYILLRISILDNVAIDKEITIYQNSLFAASNIWDFLATNMTVHLKYLQLLVFPNPLSWDYSYNQLPVVSFANPKAIFSVIIFLSLLAYAIYNFLKKNPISFSILYYLITISIVSNFVVRIASTMGERFIYTASLGFAIFIVFLGNNLLKKIRTSDFNKTIITFVILGTIILLYSYKTVNRNKDWKNNATIYKSGVIAVPNSARAHIALADSYRNEFIENQSNITLQNSIHEYERALEIYPENPSAYYSFGYLYYSINQKDKALELFNKGVSYDSLHVDMLNYIGIIYTEKNDFANGEKYFTKVLDIEPDYIHALNNLAFIYTKKKEFNKALKLYQTVVNLGKATDETYKKIGQLNNN